MRAYETAEWVDLFIAGAGAAAALAGLVFVAVSINIERILQGRGNPERGLQAVLLLLGAVVVSIFGLIPQQPSAFAVEVVAVGGALLLWLILTAPRVLSGTRGHPLWVASRLALPAPSSLALFIGGISILARAGGGMAWIVAGIVGALVSGVVIAWVLLVEIRR